MLPKPGDSVLDRVPTSTQLDAWDLAAADRDAWMEEHPGVLDALRTSFDAVKANPSDADAMLELAAAFDDYRNAARQANRTLAADLAGKLEELPWRFAERHATATNETVELFRLGVRGLIDLATGFYDPVELQALLDSVDQRLAATADDFSPAIRAVEASAAEAVEDAAAVAEETEPNPVEAVDETPAVVEESSFEQSIAEELAPAVEPEAAVEELHPMRTRHRSRSRTTSRRRRRIFWPFTRRKRPTCWRRSNRALPS